MVCESERTGRFGGGVGGKPGDDGSERAVPGCDDELERERSKSGARSEQERSSLRRSSCRQERDAARQCGFLLVLPFFFVTIILMVRRASSARASEQGDFRSARGR